MDVVSFTQLVFDWLQIARSAVQSVDIKVFIPSANHERECSPKLLHVYTFTLGTQHAVSLVQQTIKI